MREQEHARPAARCIRAGHEKQDQDRCAAHRARRRMAVRGAPRAAPRSRPCRPSLRRATRARRTRSRASSSACAPPSLGQVTGYKIALTTPAMRAMVGLNDSIAGCMLDKTILRHRPDAVARVRAADYVRLIVEFEMGFELAEDLPAIGAPYDRKRVAQAVAAVMPALELADDRNADYKALPAQPVDADRRQRLERGRGARCAGARVAGRRPRRAGRRRHDQCGEGRRPGMAATSWATRSMRSPGSPTISPRAAWAFGAATS